LNVKGIRKSFFPITPDLSPVYFGPHPNRPDGRNKTFIFLPMIMVFAFPFKRLEPFKRLQLFF